MQKQDQPKISLIIPAFNEEKRIAQTMVAWSEYLDNNFVDPELIVVLDGCTDKTAEIARQSFIGKSQLRIIDLPTNEGKGNAVKQGVLAASGEYLFFTDADLSFAPEVIQEFLAELIKGDDIVIAQRKKETQYPGLARRFIAVGSRWLIGNIVMPGVRDTQAGFKGFRREAAKKLFAIARIKRFLFDLEILLLAKHMHYRIGKVYVDWVDRPGSTVRVFVDSARSLRDLLFILFWLAIGQYERQ